MRWLVVSFLLLFYSQLYAQYFYRLRHVELTQVSTHHSNLIISEERCYESPLFLKEIKRGIITIYLDGMVGYSNRFVIITKSKPSKSISSWLVAIPGKPHQIYYMREETRKDGTYFFSITPIRFNNRSTSRLVGTILDVSTEELCK